MNQCTKSKLDKVMAQQKMAPLPSTRQVMSPTFHNVSLDLFGPLDIKDTVKRRCRKKVYGIVINCLVTRALHIDVSEDYSMEGMLHYAGAQPLFTQRLHPTS